jgi:hypothetical protein
MADVEVDLLVDLEEARRRLGEFRRELDGVERQAEEIQDRPGGPRPGGAPADEAGERPGAAARKQSKLAKEFKRFKKAAGGKINELENAAQISSKLIGAIGAQLQSIPGFKEVGEEIQKEAMKIAGPKGLVGPELAGVQFMRESGKALALGGVVPTKAILDSLRKRAVDEAERQRQLKQARKALEAKRGFDATMGLLSDLLGS